MDTKYLADIENLYAMGASFTPLNGKIPTMPAWAAAERETLDQALEWAKAGNVGMRTGTNSGGIVVVDVEAEATPEAFLELGLPETLTVRTGGGGFHYYYRVNGKKIKNSAGKLMPHIDVRGDGGQVVFPGSVHPNTGKTYEFISGPMFSEIATLPDEFLARYASKILKDYHPPAPAAPVILSGDDAYSQAAINAECDKVASAPKGTRNDTLNSSAFSLGQLVAAGRLRESDVRMGLLSSARQCGLDITEAKNAIKSGLNAGMGHPRSNLPEPKRAAPKPAAIPKPEQVASSSELVEIFRAEAAGQIKQIALPWEELNSHTNALTPGTATVLAGPAGFGKSMMAMQMVINAELQGHSWAYLPLEDDKAAWERRALAYLSDDWSVIDTHQATAISRIEMHDKFRDDLAGIMKHVVENPRKATRNPQGVLGVPPLPYTSVLSWVEGVCKTASLIIIDPLAQIEFEGREQWRQEGDFIRKLLGFAAESKTAIVLVAHTTKRGGKNNTNQLTHEDVQGSASFNRLPHTVLLLEYHENKTSRVRRGLMIAEMEHERTVVVGKARNGKGAGTRWAFRMSGPRFSELGIIEQQKRRSHVRPQD